MDNTNISNSHHYPLQSGLTTRRYIQPGKDTLGDNWKYACGDQAAPMWSLKTPSGINFTLASSCFQGACRQGRVAEAIQWGLEMIRTDGHADYPELYAPENAMNPQAQALAARKRGKGETNFWNRCFIICAEDISFGNPCMIIAASMLIDIVPNFKTQAEAEHEAIIFIKYLASSVKCRMCDWACISRIHVKEYFDFEIYFNKLCECLIDNIQPAVFGYMEGFIIASLKDKARSRKDKTPLCRTLFDKASKGVTIDGVNPVKFYTNYRILIWVALFRSLNVLQHREGNAYPTVSKMVRACYTLAIHKNFRWGKPSRLFGRMAALSIMNRSYLEPRGAKFNIGVNPKHLDPAVNWSFEETEIFRSRVRDENLIFAVPDYCQDKHTSEGKALGRNLQHFVEVKSRLRYELEEFKNMNDWYLALCFKTRYAQELNPNGTWDTSNTDIQNNIAYLPELRRKQDRLNELENIVQAHPMILRYRIAKEEWSMKNLCSILNICDRFKVPFSSRKENQGMKTKMSKLLTYFGTENPNDLLEYHAIAVKDKGAMFLASQTGEQLSSMLKFSLTLIPEEEIDNSSKDRPLLTIYLKEEILGNDPCSYGDVTISH